MLGSAGEGVLPALPLVLHHHVHLHTALLAPQGVGDTLPGAVPVSLNPLAGEAAVTSTVASGPGIGIDLLICIENGQILRYTIC